MFTKLVYSTGQFQDKQLQLCLIVRRGQVFEYDGGGLARGRRVIVAEFGDFLRVLRLQSGLTQGQVADQTGVSKTYVCALESGRKPAPPRAIVSALAACLQTDEASLWNLARGEREERMRRRIDGVPTSKRIQLPGGEPAEPSPGGSTEDALVERALDTLRKTARNPHRRRFLLDALEALVRSLRGRT